MQVKQFCKYLLIVILFLLPGIMVSCTTDSRNTVVVPEENCTSTTVLSGTETLASTIYLVMSDAFSAIRLVERLKMGDVNPYRDFFKIIPAAFKYEAEISPQVVHTGNFMHLLSERHYQGFYIYLRKLVI